MRFLVVASGGPGFTDPAEAVEVLERGIMPMFEALMGLEASGRIIAGGLPVADRSFVLIVEADSSDELDGILRDLPAWGVFDWDVTPLQSISGRAAKERQVLEQLRSS